MLEEGMKAPDFTLPDKDGNAVRLSDYLGKKVVLYCYPKDNTPGWSRQAAAFAHHYWEFCDQGVIIIGLSKDSEASHRKFAEKYDLPFMLLSDSEHKTLEDYGVWQKKKSGGKVVRTTFLIDEKGNLEKIWRKVKPDQNAGEILSYLKQ